MLGSRLDEWFLMPRKARGKSGNAQTTAKAANRPMTNFTLRHWYFGRGVVGSTIWLVFPECMAMNRGMPRCRKTGCLRKVVDAWTLRRTTDRLTHDQAPSRFRMRICFHCHCLVVVLTFAGGPAGDSVCGPTSFFYTITQALRTVVVPDPCPPPSSTCCRRSKTCKIFRATPRCALAWFVMRLLWSRMNATSLRKRRHARSSCIERRWHFSPTAGICRLTRCGLMNAQKGGHVVYHRRHIFYSPT